MRPPGADPDPTGSRSGIVVADSVTTLRGSARGRVVVAGSHGGVYAAYLAARAGARAVVLNDAGVGRERAGIGGLEWLARHAIAAAAYDHRSARIGDGADAMHRGVVTYVNRIADVLGVHPGQRVDAAAALLDEKAVASTHPVEDEHEGRHPIRVAGGATAWAIDSVSLIRPADAGAIILCGSHGALLGGDPSTALAFDARAAVFNDAGGGIDDAGYSRLAVLDARAIPGATVAASSARIGDGRSTWFDGIVSRCNDTARRLGASEGMTTMAFVECVVRGTGTAPG